MARSTRAIREARRLLDEVSLRQHPIDPMKIADHVGVDVRYEKLTEISGLTFHGERGSRIVVNELHSPTRKRFTLAHELGHHLLHSGHRLVLDPSTRVSRRDELSSLATDSQEIEANAFAAELLMPASFLRQSLTDLLSKHSDLDSTEIVAHLAESFEVSDEAMQYRLTNLGIHAVDVYY